MECVFEIIMPRSVYCILFVSWKHYLLTYLYSSVTDKFYFHKLGSASVGILQNTMIFCWWFQFSKKLQKTAIFEHF